jgi:uncharacterized phiE125 gp8 family phage protein
VVITDRKLITPPAVEPVSLAEVKLHSKVDQNAEDGLLSALIIAARQHVEKTTGRQLVTATWEVYLECFPCNDDEIELPFGELQSIDAFQWTLAGGATKSWTVSGSNLLDANSAVVAHIEDGDEAEIEVAFGCIWPPDVLRTSRGVRIRFTCGYGDDTAVPQAVKQAILLLVGHWYTHREAVSIGTTSSSQGREIPLAVDALLSNYRLHR